MANHFNFQLIVCVNMKIGIIADIHSNFHAFNEVLSKLSNIDKIICAGDLVGYNAYPNEVIKIVQEKKIPCTLGNHDKAVVTQDTSWFNPIAAEAISWTVDHITKENLNYLSNLPIVFKEQLNEYLLYVVHGSPRSPVEEYIFPDVSDQLLKEFLEETQADILVMGHTHVPFIRKIGKSFVINPGAVGQPRDYDSRASCIVLNVESEKIKIEHIRVKYNIAEAAKAIEKVGLPPMLAQRLYFGW